MSLMPSRRAALAAGVALVAMAAPAAAAAQTATQLPPVIADTVQTATPPVLGAPDQTVDGETLQRRRVAGDDAISLLLGEPGVSVQAGGGTTSLPVVRGMADDRILVTVDGAETTAFCPNHMNPPGSYVLGADVESISMSPTLSAVSAGGDNIGGVVAISTRAPRFAEAGGSRISGGEANLTYRSATRGGAASANAFTADERVSLGVEASASQGENYRSGYGRDVLSTEYASYGAAAFAAVRAGQGVTSLRVGRQFTPYQGFPNQRMDMTENSSGFADLRYDGGYVWGEVSARASFRDVRHEMNFLSDKGGDMPMLTHGKDLGLALAIKIPAGADGAIGFGIDVHRTSLDDWWPPVAGSMMMSPNRYVNINDGRRARTGAWVEWTSQPADGWDLLAGLRLERVETDAGDVQPYSWTGMMNAADAAAATVFNAKEHKRSNDTADVTLRARWTPSDQVSLEFGYARKSRVPNLYERYSWGLGAMSSAMTSLAGDANSYVGDIDLEPEVANNLAATLRLTDGPQARRSLSVSVFRSDVQDYVDADLIASLAAGFVRLRFANHDALLQGFEVSGRSELWTIGGFAPAVLSGQVSFVQGENRDTGDDLYHMSPLTARFSLEQPLGEWTVIGDLELVDRKDAVNGLRHEPVTDSYQLFNLRAVWRPTTALRIDLAVENAFDEAYDLPLGGVSYGDYKAGGSVPPIGALPGVGRSFNIGLNVTF